jgi:DNA polymerase III delta prime subunit
MSSVWNKIVGQHKAVERLQQLAINNVHAFLFIGPEGCGKEDAARAFASVTLSKCCAKVPPWTKTRPKKSFA